MEVEICGVKYTEADVPRSLAREALDAQFACNLSGVVSSMDLAMQAICAIQRLGGTTWRNHHPIMVLYLATVSGLVTGDIVDLDSYRSAKEICESVLHGRIGSGE